MSWYDPNKEIKQLKDRINILQKRKDKYSILFNCNDSIKGVVTVKHRKTNEMELLFQLICVLDDEIDRLKSEIKNIKNLK
jgi:uncharacterized small protein (DUF1192 family)